MSLPATPEKVLEAIKRKKDVEIQVAVQAAE
jgi:hypothetical protein